MALFGRKKDKEDKNLQNSDNTDNVNNVNTENNVDFANLADNDGIVHESLQQEVVEAIGQGSEDVKRLIVTIENDEKIVFTIAGGLIKNISSPVTNYDISNRLNWIDYSVYTDEDVENVVNLFDEHDYFDALVKIPDVVAGDKGIVLAETISETYTERSLKSLVYGKDKKIVSLETDWSLDSDPDVIEAYSVFNFDPKEIDFTVDSINMTNENILSNFDNGINTVLYANEETDYELSDSDVSRYVMGAVQSSYDDETGDNGVLIADLIEYSDGFQVDNVLREIERLLEHGLIQDTDPAVEPELEPEPEPIEETYDFIEPELEIEEEPEFVEPEPEEEEPELEYEQEPVEEYASYTDIINAPYPLAIEGGTNYLGGAFIQYVNLLIEEENIQNNDINELQYLVEYNTLFEQSVQGVESAMNAVVQELNRSMNFYESIAELDDNFKKNKDSNSSNLHNAIHNLEEERNDMNEARVRALGQAYTIINSYSMKNAELQLLTSNIILDKINAVEQVENLVFKNNQEEETNFDPTTIPMFYEIVKEMGLNTV